MRRKQEMNETDMKYMSEKIIQLIKDNKIKFEFYNSIVPLELLQICLNKKENTLELTFRNIQQEYINELKDLNRKNSLK